MIDTSREGQTTTRPPARLAEIPVGRLGTHRRHRIAVRLPVFGCRGVHQRARTIHVNGGERDF